MFYGQTRGLFSKFDITKFTFTYIYQKYMLAVHLTNIRLVDWRLDLNVLQKLYVIITVCIYIRPSEEQIFLY